MPKRAKDATINELSGEMSHHVCPRLALVKRRMARASAVSATRGKHGFRIVKYLTAAHLCKNLNKKKKEEEGQGWAKERRKERKRTTNDLKKRGGKKRVQILACSRFAGRISYYSLSCLLISWRRGDASGKARVAWQTGLEKGMRRATLRV